MNDTITGVAVRESENALREVRAAHHGVRLVVHSDRADFLSSVRGYLAPLLDQGEGEPHIDVRVTWNAHAPVGDAAAEGLEQLGRRIWVGPQHVRFAEIWQVPGLAMDVISTGSALEIRAAYTWPSRRARWLAALLPGAKARLFVGLTYYLVYFPWAWWLERERGWTLMHAAAVSAREQVGAFGLEDGLVLSGLPGCGKSTTALAFLDHPAWQVVSDNLLFTDGDRVFACVEPIHVDQTTRDLVGVEGALRERLRTTGRQFSYGRHDYEVVPAARSSFACPRALGFLHVGRRTGVRRLGSEEGAARLSANDHLAREWVAYQETASAMHQVWPDIGHHERRRANLVTLARSAPCYEVTTSRNENVSRSVTTLLQALEVAGE